MVRLSASLGATLARPLSFSLGAATLVAAGGGSLRAFRSEAQLAALLRRWGP
jgi:hypothetical protein